MIAKPIENDVQLASGHFLIGCDEAGRGPLAGPVTAAAVCLGVDFKPPIALDDSKKLSPKNRELLRAFITENALAFAIVDMSAETIDEVNILQATKLAMADAIRQVAEALSQKKCRVASVWIDGNQTIDGLALPQRAIVKGDSKSLHIAAASILAKQHRDALMLQWHDRYPVYGFDRHKGYPTKAHRLAIQAHGPCPIHRKSFRLLPVERS